MSHFLDRLFCRFRLLDSYNLFSFFFLCAFQQQRADQYHHFAGALLDDSDFFHPAMIKVFGLRFYEARPEEGDFMPKALCILSSHQWLTPFFESFLLNLHHLTTYRILTLHIEHYIQKFVDKTVLPPPGSLLRYESDATFSVIGGDNGRSVSAPLAPLAPLALPSSSGGRRRSSYGHQSVLLCGC